MSVETIDKEDIMEIGSGVLSKVSTVVATSLLLALSLQGNAQFYQHKMSMDLPITTQGPYWPPSAIMNKNGDFVVVGTLLRTDKNGKVYPDYNAAAIVSKDTTPPLDQQGVEDFSNPFGAPYSIIRELDISKDSSDLDIELYTSSFGPSIGNFGGGPRIPMLGESRYNLNGFHMNKQNCPELFPSKSQQESYTRKSFPLAQSPVLGYQGDNLEYHVDTGSPQTANSKNGQDCPVNGCIGEDEIHSRNIEPITLGDWLKAKVKLSIELEDWDDDQNAYTAARFTINAKNLLPHSIYTLVSLRQSFVRPSPLLKLPTPATLTSHILTDNKGKGTLSFKLQNPFPAQESDDQGVRVIGLGLAYKSDFATYGGCSLRFGAGVDIHAVAVSTANGNFDFTNFVTVPASNDKAAY